MNPVVGWYQLTCAFYYEKVMKLTNLHITCLDRYPEWEVINMAKYL